MIKFVSTDGILIRDPPTQGGPWYKIWMDPWIQMTLKMMFYLSCCRTLWDLRLRSDDREHQGFPHQRDDGAQPCTGKYLPLLLYHFDHLLTPRVFTQVFS